MQSKDLIVCVSSKSIATKPFGNAVDAVVQHDHYIASEDTCLAEVFIVDVNGAVLKTKKGDSAGKDYLAERK